MKDPQHFQKIEAQQCLRAIFSARKDIFTQEEPFWENYLSTTMVLDFSRKSQPKILQKSTQKSTRGCIDLKSPFNYSIAFTLNLLMKKGFCLKCLFEVRYLL